MPEFKLNGKTYSGSTSYASAISYTKDDGSKTTVQDKISELAYRPVNNNILINSNFANPVNQRGVTAETWIPSRYGIDRWITNITFSSITNGLTIGSLGTTGFLSQRFEEGTIVNGKKYSFSICIDGVIYNGTNTADNSKGMVFVNNDIIKAYIDYSTDNDYWYLGLEFKTVGVTIEWAKLELGEVTTPYVPRLYDEEWLLCQRYYKIFAPMRIATYAIGNTELIHTTPIDMRVNPTVTLGINRVSNITNADVSSWANKKVVQIFVKKSSNGHFDLNMDVTLDAEL